MSARTSGTRWATGLGLVALLGGAATTVARSLSGVPGVASDTWAMVSTFTDYGLLGYAVALVLLAGAALLGRSRRQVLAVVAAAALTAVHASWLLPRYVPDGDAAVPDTALSVLAANLRLGEAAPASVADAAAGADVVVLTEVTSGQVADLREGGFGDRFPHQAGGPLPRSGSKGTTVFSRFPLGPARPVAPDLGHQCWLVEVAVPGLGPVTVAAVHPRRPYRGGSSWAAAQEDLRTSLPRSRTVVAGDFNAVDSHPGMRRFGRLGFRDSDDIVGAGWQPTYPATGRIPPLIGIDHVLVSADLTATAFRTVDVAGTDHRAVQATVGLRSPG